MSNKTLCANTGGLPDETRLAFGETFAHCPTCDRVLKLKKDGRFRQHSVRGKNTASSDRLMSNLFAIGEVPS